jgi:hypothetical protein
MHALRQQQRLGRGLQERQRQHQQPQQRVACPSFPHIKSDIAVASGYTFALLVQAYYDCRQHKRNTSSALRFELDLERNLMELHERLLDGSYRPGKSICFAITWPKPREVWAADFTDRVVHHLIYNYLAPIFLPRFIADSCACIPGRGTLYAAQRLQAHARSVTQNWQRPAMYCKMDLANFFGSIDKSVLWAKMAPYIRERWWRDLIRTVVFHDPRSNFDLRGDPADLRRVPRHKRLMFAPEGRGLAIGNLIPSQFGANILLDAVLDKFVKHHLRAKYYVRYVDDFVLLHESSDWLYAARAAIEAHLPQFHLSLNPRKTVTQPVMRGIDFAGFVVKPHRLEPRRRVVHHALRRIETAPINEVYETGNSYLGLIVHSDSRHDRAKIANALRKRGLSVSASFTKAYRPRGE